MTQADRDTDSSLLLAVAAGDQSALARLYDRNAGLLLAAALRVLRDRREAEDLLHDLFLEVWRCAGDFDPRRGNARSWLMLRARCRAVDRRRSPRLSRMDSLDDGAWRPEPVAPVEVAELAPDAARARDALQSLPDEQRLVVEMGVFDGLSSSEIAQALGVPIGTVKSRTAAARGKLRVLLGASVA